ncbi:DUF3426 domain-containing protein [Marinomonas sp. 5E14-1]|uniref:DUF3426 domain-containing protein n=1 Tax=Marinomonas sp. 5E14-1 TaxID=3153922 RepID=UPI00326543BE
MANSLITRCPKCSTAFRVNDEVLSMAKGKVRCGQCFHIFDAHASKPTLPETTEKPEATKKPEIQTKKQALAQKADTPEKKATPKPSPKEPDISTTESSNVLISEQGIITEDDILNLFNESDLTPLSGEDLEASKKVLKERKAKEAKANTTAQKEKEPAKQYQERAKSARGETTPLSHADRNDSPAPWEVELAEVEAALSAQPRTPKVKKEVVNKTKEEAKATTPTPFIESKPSPKTETVSEPDYMAALQSLAQTASEQTCPSDAKNQHTILEQLSAQESLAPLLEENPKDIRVKSKHRFLWLFASLLGLALLAGQASMHFFEEGSRSSNFRSFYQMICSYSGCTLPGFEDIDAISIQHVRIQSHPSIPNSLLVNAIITNVSSFSQPMPKIALEFSDLNGSPVAARLFSPSDYLHKDFLDITYMPPSTPIHVVIPIQDPGARAVTHQLKTFPSKTRSY